MRQKNKKDKNGACEKTGMMNLQKAWKKEEKWLPSVDSTKAITFVQETEPAVVLKCDVWLTGCLEFINFAVSYNCW